MNAIDNIGLTGVQPNYPHAGQGSNRVQTFQLIAALFNTKHFESVGVS
jgi:hypothetical protein